MSEPEQDAAIGRMVRTYCEQKRAMAAMELEMDRFSSAFLELGNALRKGDDSRLETDAPLSLIQTNTALGQLGMGKLVEMLTEYSETRRSLKQKEQSMRSLGIF